jgi:cation transporter-like permease
MGQPAYEAFGITATLFVLFLFGAALGDGLGEFMSGVGLLALGGTFAIIYLLVFGWVLWFYRRR